MTQQEVIKWLWRYGHFRNPLYPEALNLHFADLTKLQYKDKVVQDAIRSFQEIDAHTDVFGQQYHGRNIDHDGLIGPATLETMNLPRCGESDHHGQFADIGVGSWDAGCIPEFPGVHAIYVNLNTASMPSWWKDNWEEISDNLTRMMHEVGQHPIFRFDESDAAHMSIRFRRLSGSTIGMNDVPSNPSCNSRIGGSIDSGWDADVHLLTILGAHEWFVHGNGLYHSRGGIGNPSILRVPLSWKGDPFESDLKRYFGGPIDLTPAPEPEPEPEPEPDPDDPDPVPEPAAGWLERLINMFLRWIGGLINR